jgi:hypothetical protein
MIRFLLLVRRDPRLPILGLLVAALALALAQASVASPERTRPCEALDEGEHVDRAKTIIGKAFSTKRILDEHPVRRSERRAWRAHKLCVQTRSRRRAIARRVKSRKRKFDARFEALITPPGPGTLAARRQCESGGNYSINTGNGYAGAYQFDVSSWAATAHEFKRRTGIRPDPSRTAEPREQDIRAAIWHQISGGDPWPNCPRLAPLREYDRTLDWVAMGSTAPSPAHGESSGDFEAGARTPLLER